MLINGLIMFFSSFAGTLGALALYSHIQRMRQVKVLMELKKELQLKLDTELTFAQLAAQLRKEMGDGID